VVRVEGGWGLQGYLTYTHKTSRNTRVSVHYLHACISSQLDSVGKVQGLGGVPERERVCVCAREGGGEGGRGKREGLGGIEGGERRGE